MLGQFFSSLGGAIGGAFGGGILSTIGRFAGGLLGSYLEKLNYDPEEYTNFTNIRNSFNFSKACYGDPIPLIFGCNRINGKIIWTDEIKEVQNTSTEKKYFANSGRMKAIYHTVRSEYYLSFAVAICEGEIAEFGRMWVDDDVVELQNYKFRLYNGSETQLPDPLILSKFGEKDACGFRGLAYVVFEDLPLSDFGYVVPNFSFEVTRKAKIDGIKNTEDLVKSMIMIPGSGEFAYDTIVQQKIINTPNGVAITSVTLNSHNYANIADSIYSLNQLKVTCENVEWVAPVVCWFGNDLDAGRCKIRPCVEYNDKNLSYSEAWRVAGYDRYTAPLISRDEQDNPLYGGSINDASVVRYLEELKKRNLNIMFYPMFFMDVHLKPWRGHVTGSADSIVDFFNKQEGYNNFILHYARLVKDRVDAFVIGSELIGLTKVRSGNDFPAVSELIKLARMVKEILGPKVLVTYAADWSEYHHTEGGWYNLDPLWACPYIDFIGIDCYFPVTRTTNSVILQEDIENGWKSGEGYDYYIDYATGNRHDLTPEYAWKNLKYWWENQHRNPDGQITQWQPKMKKIWFTEFGFPSIDKATNQPNVFFDPYCSDGGVPRYSSGEVDFGIQRRAIKAFIEYWQKEEYIGQMFLWTWDARPYPAWPHMNIWRDDYLWEKGHWVNNKFTAASLAAIISEFSVRAGINIEQVDAKSLDEAVQGVVFNKKLNIIDAINILRIGYFFDIVASAEDKIQFVKRGQNKPYEINSDSLMSLGRDDYYSSNNSGDNYLYQEEIALQSIISKLEISFIEQIKNYKIGYCQVNSENISTKATYSVKLPIIFSQPEAQRLGRLILKNALTEDKVIKFILPLTELQIQPADIVTLVYLGRHYQIRVIEIKLQGLFIAVTGIFDNFKSYHIPTTKGQEKLIAPISDMTVLKLLDSAAIFTTGDAEQDSSKIVIYLQSSSSKVLYAAIDNQGQEQSQNYIKIGTINQGAIIGKLESFKNKGDSEDDKTPKDNNDQAIKKPSEVEQDSSPEYIVYCPELERSLRNNWHLALCGKEIIKFSDITPVGTNLYKLTGLSRGELDTSQYIDSHQIGEDFIILEAHPNILNLPHKMINKPLKFKLSNNKNLE